MTKLICGLIIFLGIHSVSIFANNWRTAQVKNWGAITWKLIYSMISIAGLALITVGYLETRPQPITIWSPPPWAWLITVYFSLVTMILVAAAYIPNNAFKAKLKDPMLVGVIVWAICHLTTIGSLGGILLFGSVLIWAILDLISCKKRRSESALAGSQNKPTGTRTFATTVVGLMAWTPFAHIAYGISR
jgi:uncharacterized membrane protein